MTTFDEHPPPPWHERRMCAWYHIMGLYETYEIVNNLELSEIWIIDEARRIVKTCRNNKRNNSIPLMNLYEYTTMKMQIEDLSRGEDISLDC